MVFIQDMQEQRETRINVMDGLDKQVNTILVDDYVKTVRFHTGTELTCTKIATLLSISGGIFTGIGSILAFSAGFFRNEYLSYASGCTSVIAIVFIKSSYYANSQSHYHDGKLKNLLTKEYQIINKFVKDPSSLPPVAEPNMPDAGNGDEDSTKTPDNGGGTIKITKEDV